MQKENVNIQKAGSKKEIEINTFVNDIIDITKNRIIVDLVIELKNNCRVYEVREVELNLRKLGFSNECDYEFQLSKDLDRIVKKFYYENNKLPSIEEIEKEMYKKNYLIIKINYERGER